MGLDQYAFSVGPKPGATDFYYPGEEPPVELAYWRKHPNLEGWMEKLFNYKADAQWYEGRTEFSDEVIMNAIPIEENEITPELQSMFVNDEEMNARVKEEQTMSRVINSSKRRVFNCQPIRLNNADLDQLEMHVRNGTLPKTQGFFFGEDSDESYRDQDLEFIEKARKAIFEGFDVYYFSWW